MEMNATTIDVGGRDPILEQWALSMADLENPSLTWIRWTMIVVTVVAVVVGIPGNLLVIGSILFVKSLRQLHHAFIVNLALCDFGVMVMDAFVLIGAIYGERPFIEKPWLCELCGFICMLSCFGSLWSMMFIAINRYLFILHNPVYHKVFSVRGTVVSLILLWVCVCSLDAVNWPFIGIWSHGFNIYGLHCSFVMTINFFYNMLMVSGLAVAFPALIVLFCYSRILYTTYKLADKFGGSASGVNKKRQQEQKQLTRSLVTIFALFCVTWFPIGAVIFLLGMGNNVVEKVPLAAAVLLEVLAHVNSAINYIVLGLTHTGFRQAYFQIFRAIFGCKKENSTSTSVQKSETTK